MPARPSGSSASSTPRLIQIPYTPRPQQAELHALLETTRFVVAVCHRRMGKTVMAINHLIRAAVTCPRERPRFAYIAPTYRQGKDAAWSYLTHYSAPIPGRTLSESELHCDYPNGGRVRLYDSDNPDSLRGIYLDGVVLDEYGLMSRVVWGEVVRPLLADRQGWALLLGTPNGRNQFWDMARLAKQGGEWAYREYPVSQTHLLSDEAPPRGGV